MRKANIERNTKETEISLWLGLEGTGSSDIETGVGFLNHMLDLFTRHGRFDMDLKCDGDTEVDDHHSTEDIGIALGEAFREALGEKRGICRYADIVLPMDEALVLAAVDISGRGYLSFDVPIPTEKVGTFDTELVKEFFLAFCRTSGVSLHFRLLSGENSHHIIEAVFKAFGRIMKEAVSIDPDFRNEIPSTKGIL
ncbi:MAG: imidazoleglycerol-phosphate dehydratase HisB [Eubacteriales bacterium]|nr:imidazoleglycerol-phosphate dehydratase HisB [Eubacteriales bacterium]